MTDTKFQRTHWLKSFWIFVSHFFHICFVLRGVLGVLLTLVLCGGLAVALCEGLSVWKGIYFAVVTSTSVGYGDIAPTTVIGQCISVALALIGTVFFGLIVAAATRAVEVAIRDYQGAPRSSLLDPIDGA
jgi:voltage-gated potassium channel